MMKKPVTLWTALVLCVLCTAPALAQKGGSGNASERSEAASGNSSNRNEGNAGSGSGNAGNDNAGGGRSGGGNAGVGGGGGNASGNGGGTGGADPGGPAGDDVVQLPREQQLVQSAVRAGAALPLEDILAIVEQESDGRVLDLELVRFRGSYLYAITVLERNGILHKLYYYARSGRRVRNN